MMAASYAHLFRFFLRDIYCIILMKFFITVDIFHEGFGDYFIDTR